MKKKIIITTVGSFIFLFILITIILLFQFNKDLTCEKKYEYEDIEIVETVKASFKNISIDKVIGEFEMTFKSQKEASSYYSNYKYKKKLLIMGNKITYSTNETEAFKEINRNRYTLKKNLESKKLGYLCN